MLVHDRFCQTSGVNAQTLHPHVFAGFIHSVDMKTISAGADASFVQVVTKPSKFCRTETIPPDPSAAGSSIEMDI
jgi:hypothetical protein